MHSHADSQFASLHSWFLPHWLTHRKRVTVTRGFRDPSPLLERSSARFLVALPPLHLSLPRSLSDGGDLYHNVTDVGATHSSVLGIHCKNNVKWTLTLTVNYFQSPFLRMYTHFPIKLAVRFRKHFLHVSQCSSVLQCVRPTSWVCVHNTCEWV